MYHSQCFNPTYQCLNEIVKVELDGCSEVNTNTLEDNASAERFSSDYILFLNPFISSVKQGPTLLHLIDLETRVFRWRAHDHLCRCWPCNHCKISRYD